MKRIFTIIVILLAASFTLKSQSKEILDFGEIIMATAFEEGTVVYEGEKMPDKFMSYILIGKNKLFVTSEYFDRRLEIPYDTKTSKDNAYTFLSLSTFECVTINLDKCEVFYVKYIEDEEKAKAILTADIDMIKSMALLEVIKD